MKTVIVFHFKIEQFGFLAQHAFTLGLKLNGRCVRSNIRQRWCDDRQNKISYRHAFINRLRVRGILYSSDYISIVFSDIQVICIRNMRCFERCHIAFIITIFA